MKFFYRSLIALTLIITFTMCKEQASPITVGSNWQVECIYVNGQKTEVPQGQNVTLGFLKGNKVTGESGCNRFFGSYSISDNKNITVGSLGATRMYCPNMDFENAYLKLLEEVSSFKVDNGTLTLMDENGSTIATLKKLSAPIND